MTALSERQLARVECLRLAREVLAPRNVMGVSSVDAIDLVNVALYIDNGEDPYALQPALVGGGPDAVAESD